MLHLVPTFDITYRILNHVDVARISFGVLAKFSPFASTKTDALGVYGRLAIGNSRVSGRYPGEMEGQTWDQLCLHHLSLSPSPPSNPSI
jgi:hypothetical protein